MRTKKRARPSKTIRERYSLSRVRRSQKALENLDVPHEKVPELIKPVRTESPSKFSAKKFPMIRDVPSSKYLDSKLFLAQGGMNNVLLGDNAVDGMNIDFKECNGDIAAHVLDSIFSPAFHISKYVAGGTTNAANYAKVLGSEGNRIDHKGKRSSQVDFLNSVVPLETSVAIHKEERTTICQRTGVKMSELVTEMNLNPNMSLKQSEFSQSCCQIPTQENSVRPSSHEDLVGMNLPFRASDLLFSVQHQVLDTVYEASKYTLLTLTYGETDDDDEESHDFGSYLIIRNLPDLSSVVPTYRSMLLPKQTRSCPPTTLVLDLDETLVHSQLEPINDADITIPLKFDSEKHMIYVKCRPHVKDFLERVAVLFEVVIFTASTRVYAERLLNVLDPKRKLCRHRAFRDSCIIVGGNYFKDLSVLGRDLAHVIIVDNSPEAFGFQVNNGIQIESWFGDRSDQELLLLLPFLEKLARAEDVRPLIAKKYNLQEKIAAAVILHSTLSKSPLECKLRE